MQHRFPKCYQVGLRRLGQGSLAPASPESRHGEVAGHAEPHVSRNMVPRLGETARHATASQKRCSRLRKTDIYENWVGKSVGRGLAEWRCWPINFRSSEISVDFAPAVCKFFSAPASRAARTKPTGRPGRTMVFREVACRAGKTQLFARSDLKRIALKAQNCNIP